MTSSAEQSAVPTALPRNVAARVGAWAAAVGVGSIVAIFVTPMLWLLYGGVYTFFMAVSGLVAIVAGHVGRIRGKRMGGRDRGLALLAIVTGWLLLFCVLVIVVTYFGLAVGLAALS
ncbi:hypothetical protein [Streptomyces sp. NPDC048111]|uniref:hypothetical protein n=1 Tax=Streptomyces sp. NPDC048111 TaxID=3365500 RepID=UPI0037236AF1